MCDKCGRLLKAIDAYLKKEDDDLSDIFDDEDRVDPDGTVDEINNLEDDLSDILLSETEYYINEIKKKKTLGELLDSLEEIKSRDIYGDEIKDAMSKSLHRLVPKYTQAYVTIVDAEIKVNRLSQRTFDWIDRWSKRLGELMKLTTNDEIEKLVKQGLETGEDIASLTLKISQSGIRDEYYRARRVAVTEILRAHNVAKWEADMQNPCVTKKMWRHTGAYKNQPRENHVEMDGQIVDVYEPFQLIGRDGTVYYPQFPVDPILPPEEAINCHCISQSIVDESILQKSLQERKALQQQAIDEMDDEWERELDAENRARAGIE